VDQRMSAPSCCRKTPTPSTPGSSAFGNWSPHADYDRRRRWFACFLRLS
jgi:hypothetical protein